MAIGPSDGVFVNGMLSHGPLEKLYNHGLYTCRATVKFIKIICPTSKILNP